MKKIFGLVVAVSLLGFAGSASADTCGQNYRADMVTDPITLVVTTVQTPTVFLPCEGGDPMRVVQAWGLNGYQTPTLNAGQIISDEAGITDMCPVWYPVTISGKSCFDVSHTDMYRNQAREIARGLQKNGTMTHYAQDYSYWLSH